MPERFNISISDLHCLSAIPRKVIPSATVVGELHIFFNVGFVQGGELHLTISKEDSLKLVLAMASVLGFKVVTGPGETRLEPDVRATEIREMLSLAISCIPIDSLPKTLADWYFSHSNPKQPDPMSGVRQPDVRDTQPIPPYFDFDPSTEHTIQIPSSEQDLPPIGRKTQPSSWRAPSSKPPSPKHPETEPIDSGEPL